MPSSHDSQGFNAGDSPGKPRRCYVKRVFDLFGSTVLLVLLSPLMLLVAIAIILESRHPIFFAQERLGLHGITFRMIKFRTMQPGSESTTPVNQDGSLITHELDPRITRVGRVLRRFSLDELPQLVNVLKGEMSLVGPRPDLPFHAQFYSVIEHRKLSVRPGITGLAQVSGRNTIPWKQRIAYELKYVEDQSLLLDLKILALTVAQVLRPKGIYQPEVPGCENRSVPS